MNDKIQSLIEDERDYIATACLDARLAIEEVEKMALTRISSTTQSRWTPVLTRLLTCSPERRLYRLHSIGSLASRCASEVAEI